MSVTKRPKPVHQMTEGQFETMFPVGNEDACKAYLKARRWPQGVTCPRCGNPAVYDLPSRKWHWQCTKCAPGGFRGYRFSIITGTIFENTNKPLRQWFKVVHLMTTSKKGISALQIQRQMGFGSYGTAHSMCHKIRAAMIEPEKKLGGIVEVDETWIGGKDQNKHFNKRSGGRGGSGSGKTPIIGAVKLDERGLVNEINEFVVTKDNYFDAVVPANCSECEGYRTVVEYESEYLCVNCFTVCEQLEACGWCGAESAGVKPSPKTFVFFTYKATKFSIRYFAFKIPALGLGRIGQ
jgi:hypothetical protein